MTVLTLHARYEADADRLHPVPWQRMIWVTWRQHRAAFISVMAVLAAAAAFEVAEGLKIRHDYAALAACRPLSSASCQALNSVFNSSDWHVANTVDIVMQVVPLLIGMFAGASVLARDLETGTFRFAWTQGIGRERWTIAKLVFFGVPVAVAAAALGELNAWFMAPILPQENMTVMTATVFDTRGIAFPAWTLTAFMIGAFLGMLLRRILPAMAVTMGVYAALAVVTWLFLRPNYPIGGFWPAQLLEGAWLVVLSVALTAATVWLARRRAA
ncbi:MAG TPA: hypothetical protein VG142_04985 [Trebonia sp.]|nr:hypothetical protein [Trebonia sp.]